MKKNITLFLAIMGFMLAPALIKAQTFVSVDINPGADSSFPAYFTVAAGKVFFAAKDGTHGNELWVTDGTAAGTNLVKDIWPGTGGSYVSHLMAFNNKLYFVADDSVHGTELWVSDGTAGGTSMVADIWPGKGGSAPYSLTVWNNELLFGANDSTHGAELWISDGTSGGTHMVADIQPGTGSSSAGYFSGFYAFNNNAYFAATDGTHGTELWVTDGTSGGTAMVADIYPGGGSSDAGLNGFKVYNNKLYFSANDSVHGTELWTTDGTTLGTVLFDDIFAGPGNSSPYDLTLFNNKMYFNANDSVHGAELWVTDGTLGGTAMVADIYPGSGGSSPANMTLFNNEIYFEASNASHAQIWKTDGTTAGTVQVTNIFTSNGFGFYAPVVNDNQLFFQGTDSITIWQFFSMNTSDSLTLLAPGIAPNPNPLDLCSSEVAYGNSIIYCASYNSIGDELWIYTPAFTAIGQVNEMSGISAYPNPFTNNISLNGLKNGELYQLTLTDIQGRTVNAYEVNGTGSAQTLQMPETLANGVYMLQISSHGAVENVRLVKQ